MKHRSLRWRFSDSSGHQTWRQARRMVHGFALMLCVLLLSGPAFAQPSSDNPPALPQPGSAPDSPVWISIAVSFILFALVMFVSLRQGKRGHQD